MNKKHDNENLNIRMKSIRVKSMRMKSAGIKSI